MKKNTKRFRKNTFDKKKKGFSQIETLYRSILKHSTSKLDEKNKRFNDISEDIN